MKNQVKQILADIEISFTYCGYASKSDQEIADKVCWGGISETAIDKVLEKYSEKQLCEFVRDSFGEDATPELIADYLLQEIASETCIETDKDYKGDTIAFTTV